VYLLSKTGQTKRALFLIIEDLGDVSQAISFTKENPDLWDDLLDYSMDKPKFIRALLEEVGTSINPITVVRRIPNGLEVEGLREGIGKMIREYEIQHSISDGVAKVLRGEVTSGMDVLRAGQKKAVKFEVKHEKSDEVEMHADAVPIINGNGMDDEDTSHGPTIGHCVGCKDVFHQDGKICQSTSMTIVELHTDKHTTERETLIGFNCGHVFHLSCLLNIDTKADQADVDRLQRQRLSEDEEVNDTGRSVQAKVEHAHQIKRAVQGGCPVCTLPDESD
jgi:hypothetical protein